MRMHADDANDNVGEEHRASDRLVSLLDGGLISNGFGGYLLPRGCKSMRKYEDRAGIRVGNRKIPFWNF